MVGVYVKDNAFRDYKKGVFEKGCTSIFGNHAVAAVGYGTEKGKPYWLIKNSWGTKWGEKGYIKIRSGKNICGVENVCVALQCVKTGTAAPAPVPPPPVPPNPALRKHCAAGRMCHWPLSSCRCGRSLTITAIASPARHSHLHTASLAETTEGKRTESAGILPGRAQAQTPVLT